MLRRRCQPAIVAPPARRVAFVPVPERSGPVKNPLDRVAFRALRRVRIGGLATQQGLFQELWKSSFHGSLHHLDAKDRRR